VDERLYLNLDNKIKGIWSKDIPGNLAKANQQWRRIASVPAAAYNLVRMRNLEAAT
jgi:hypothetical protein